MTNITIIILYIYIGDFMKKRFKAKRKIKFKKIIFIILIIALMVLLKTYISKINITSKNTNFIKNVLMEIDKKSISNLLDKLNNNLFNNPVYILQNQLKYNKEESTAIFAYTKVDKPKIYIYNSHQNEEYSIKYLEDYNIKPNVLMASNMLKEKLTDLNINTIVEENNILEYMNKNNLDHSGSYIASRHFLEKVIKSYNSIELYIDLHRDAISHDLSHININNKDCAKIMFVIGLENPNYERNLSVVSSINSIINNKYSGLSRGIMKKKGYGVNGVYNQDLNSNVILI